MSFHSFWCLFWYLAHKPGCEFFMQTGPCADKSSWWLEEWPIPGQWHTTQTGVSLILSHWRMKKCEKRKEAQIQNLKSYGHEIYCHNLSHNNNRMSPFWMRVYKEQKPFAPKIRFVLFGRHTGGQQGCWDSSDKFSVDPCFRMQSRDSMFLSQSGHNWLQTIGSHSFCLFWYVWGV